MTKKRLFIFLSIVICHLSFVISSSILAAEPAKPALKFVLLADGTAQIKPDLVAGTAYGWAMATPTADGQTSALLVWIEGNRPRWAFYTLPLLSDGVPQPPPVPPPPPPIPVPVNPYTPTPAWQSTVAPIAATHIGRDDANRLAEEFSIIGAEVGKTTSPIKTTADLRQALIDYGKPLGLKGKYPGLAAAVDKVFTDTLSLDVKTLDRQQASALLTTLAWAVWEAGKPAGK